MKKIIKEFLLVCALILVMTTVVFEMQYITEILITKREHSMINRPLLNAFISVGMWYVSIHYTRTLSKKGVLMIRFFKDFLFVCFALTMLIALLIWLPIILGLLTMIILRVETWGLTEFQEFPFFIIVVLFFNFVCYKLLNKLLNLKCMEKFKKFLY